MNDESNESTTGPPPRLVRRPEGKVIAGVCTGLAAYTGVDPVAWRIGFVVATLFTGIGLVGYIVAWLVMPMARHDEPAPPSSYTPMDAGRWIAMGAIALGALVVIRSIFDIQGRWFWGLLLIGIGFAIWGRDWSARSHHRPPPPRGPVDPPDTWLGPTPNPVTSQPTPPQQTPPEAPVASAAFSAPAAPTAPVASTAPTTPIVPPRPQRPPKPPRPKREPSILGRLVIGAAAFGIGVTLLLSNLGVFDASPRFIVGMLLGIVGTGLVVGSWWGRARWLIFPGIVLALILSIVSIIPFHTRGGAGAVLWSPKRISALSPSYEHMAGPAVLDLSHVKFASRERDVDVRLGFGPLLVVVPDDVHVSVDAHVQGGVATLFGEPSNGWDITQTATSRGKRDGGQLNLHAAVTFGPLEVRRELPGDADGDFRGAHSRFRFGQRNGSVNRDSLRIEIGGDGR